MKRTIGSIWVVATLLVSGCHGQAQLRKRELLEANSKWQEQTSNTRRLLKGLCQGDCDSSADCEGDLICFHRDANDPIPSGCDGGREEWSSDYCIKKPSEKEENDVGVADDGSSTTTNDSFRLKIYWQPGYNWQDEYRERKWCLVRNFNVWGTCWDGLLRTTCYPERVHVTKCGDTDGQDWQFVLVGDGETLIKSGNSNSCLERIGWDVELRTCDKDVAGQRFFAPNGSLDGRRFELSQQSAPGLCLNQDHHPKNAEYVSMRPCWQSRHWDSLTSYWERA